MRSWRTSEVDHRQHLCVESIFVTPVRLFVNDMMIMIIAGLGFLLPLSSHVPSTPAQTVLALCCGSQGRNVPLHVRFVAISPEPLVNTSLTLHCSAAETQSLEMRTVILACLVASAGAFGTVRPPSHTNMKLRRRTTASRRKSLPKSVSACGKGQVEDWGGAALQRERGGKRAMRRGGRR